MAGVKGRSGGRNARTVQEHAREGTLRADRHGDVVSPNPPEGVPTEPKPLEGDAQAEWDRMIRRLTDSGSLSSVDDGALYQACLVFAETEALAISMIETAASIDILEENLHGLEKGQLVQCFQEITKLRQLEAGYSTKILRGRLALRTFYVEFGLTPASRGRVRLTPKKDDHKKTALEQLQARKLRLA